MTADVVAEAGTAMSNLSKQPLINKSQRSTVLNTFTRHTTPGAPQTPVPRLVHPTPCPPLPPPVRLSSTVQRRSAPCPLRRRLQP